MKIGKKCWAIAEGYIPSYSHGTGRDFISHEAICILNATDRNASVEIFLYFTDKEPIGPYKIAVPARRSKHVRINDLNDPMPVPKGIEFSSIIKSDVEIVVQHTRLDSRQAENALMTTIAYPCE